MASKASRSATHFNQENAGNGKTGAIIKKRTAVPVTRNALGAVTNQKALQKNVSLKQGVKPLLRQKANLKSVVGKRPVACLTKLPGEYVKFTKTEKTKFTKQPIVRLTRLSEKHVETEPMEMDALIKDEKAEQGNVFDVTDKPGIEDIDEYDSINPQLCSEFVNDIYQYMLCLEAEYPIKKQYLKGTALKPRMRTILVDWLVQVHHKFGLLQETLYLTIAIFDRFLQLQPVSRAKLQLAGVTAMLIASKYEEMYAPEVSDFVYITDEAYSKSQILQMEITMLKTLGFNLGCPLSLHFLRRNSKAGQVDANHHTLAKYLMELSMIDYEMCHVAPSKIAAAALCLSIKLLDAKEWLPVLQHYSRYSYQDLQPVIYHLAKNLKAAGASPYHAAIRTKYASPKALKISQIEELQSPLVLKLAKEAAEVSL